MKKFNYLLACILLLLFNCNQAYINENLSQEKQPLEEGKFNRGFPIYLKLSDNSEKKGDFVIKTSVGEQQINNVDFSLNNDDFYKFKQNFNLINYNKILQVHFLSDSKLDYTDHRVDKEELKRMMIYYVDENNKPHLDVLKRRVLSAEATINNKNHFSKNNPINAPISNGEYDVVTYNQVSDIYANAINHYLLDEYNVEQLPLFSMVQPQDIQSLEQQIDWASLSEDESYLQLYDLYNNDVVSGGCASYSCLGPGGECSVWNPNVCGSICQLVESVQHLVEYPGEKQLPPGLEEDGEPLIIPTGKEKKDTKQLKSYDDLAQATIGFFPEIYELRKQLNATVVGKQLVNNYYNMGQLTFKGEVKIPLNLKIEVLYTILSNRKKITDFTQALNISLKGELKKNHEYSKKTLFSIDESKKYLSLLNKIKQVSGNEDFNNFVTSYEEIIKQFEGKTISNIINTFKVSIKQ